MCSGMCSGMCVAGCVWRDAWSGICVAGEPGRTCATRKLESYSGLSFGGLRFGTQDPGSYMQSELARRENLNPIRVCRFRGLRFGSALPGSYM